MHPSIVLKTLVPYAKSFSTIESVFSHINKKHFDNLLNSGKCDSFSRFYGCLFD